MKVELYEPAMCCPTGLCGPSPDPVLMTFSDSVLALKKQGVEVDRFSLSQQLAAFRDNPKVAELLRKNGKKILPITLVNGEVVKTSSYPSYEELCKTVGIEPLKSKPFTLQVLNS